MNATKARANAHRLQQCSGDSSSDDEQSSGPPVLCRQASDELRLGLPMSTTHRLHSAACHTLNLDTRNHEVLNIVFLDIDGVVAPRINAGQIVWQCMEAVAALCRLAKAQVVLTSSWRLIEGKMALLDTLLKDHHQAAGIFDVVPDLRGSVSLLHPPPKWHKAHYVNVDELVGFSEENAVAALKILGCEEICSRADSTEHLAIVFSDEKYDCHVFSELTGAYSYQSFSPHSRRGVDWSHEPCTELFARTRRCEIAAWLQQAEAQDIQVSNWVVIDDDDLWQDSGVAGDSLQRKPRSQKQPGSIPQRQAPAACDQGQRGDGVDDQLVEDLWQFSF